jgi:hypothetical protein
MIFTLIFSSVIGGELWKKEKKRKVVSLFYYLALMPTMEPCMSLVICPPSSVTKLLGFLQTVEGAVTFTKDFFEKISSKFSIYIGGFLNF